MLSQPTKVTVSPAQSAEETKAHSILVQHRNQVQVLGKRSLLTLKTLAGCSNARVLEFLPELLHFEVGLHHSWSNQFFLTLPDAGQL